MNEECAFCQIMRGAQPASIVWGSFSESGPPEGVSEPGAAENELHPVPPEGLDGMLSTLLPIAAAHVLGRAIQLAAPADALGVCGVCWYPPGHSGKPHR